MSEPQPDFSNRAYLFPAIDREGYRFGGAVLFLACLLAVGSWWVPALTWLVGPLLLLAWGTLLFFRDPDRCPPTDPSALVSPADGRVCLIQECEMPDAIASVPEVAGRKYWRVSVFMSVFNVHINRLPSAGTIVKKDYVAAGKFFNASLDKASKENERCNYLVKTDDGRYYGVTQIAGLVARRIVPRVKEGDHLERAERFGLIRFGSRLDIYLPEGVKPTVRVGQVMVAGETVLATI